jgi:hypothetical protein
VPLAIRLRIVRLRRPFVVALVLVITLVTPGPLRADPPRQPRLRLMNPRLGPIVQAGRGRSPSFRALLERLDATDVVVYVQCAPLRTRLDGKLNFLAAAGGLRYVLVRIAWDLTPERKIAILGHELQHALEVAQHPDIVSAETMAIAYERFGFTKSRGLEQMDFDTRAAVDAGVTIWKELLDRGDGD